jgi:DnaK suppressor protein
MDKKQTEEFRKQLIEQRERIVAGWSDDEVAEGDVLRDPEELATLITRSEVEDQLAEDDRNLVEKIDFALRRLDAGTYGLCIGCGGEIPLARLEAKPSVSLCIDCQEKKDAEAE